MSFLSPRVGVLVGPLLVTASAVSASPLSFDLYGQLRAGRWGAVEGYFSDRNPTDAAERYAAATARMQALRSAGAPARGQWNADLSAAFRGYLAAAGIGCPPGHQAEVLVACVGGVPPESRRAMVERLALWKASEYARIQGLGGFANALVLRASLEQDDPINRRIYASRLQTLLESGAVADAASLAARRQVGGSMSDLWRARAYVRAGDRDAALAAFIASARGTRAGWILRAIVQDMRRTFPELLRGQALPGRPDAVRDITALAEYLSPQEIAGLRSALTPDRIVSTTNAGRASGDGAYLIAAGYGSAIHSLARASYTYLSQNPETLEAWARSLKAKQQSDAAIALLDGFETARAARPSLWEFYIELLEAGAPRERYFAETLEFLAAHPQYYSIQDRLISALIGDDARRIQWAPDAHWTRANQILPEQTGKGRFVYWYKRYLQSRNRQTEVERLQRDFYLMAPGSFYAAPFWDAQGPSGDYVRDWNDAFTREDYLRWVGRHGDNEAAQRFLARRNIARFTDPEAARLWKDLDSGRYSVPEDAALLFRLGEPATGSEYIQILYKDRVSRNEFIARQAAAGLQSGNLHMSVYYTRWLLRELNAPEDPYTLPPGLLKILYPRPHRSIVLNYASKYGISEHKVYALMRQESMFNERAISRSGARGLMQIMPATGRWLAPKLGLQSPDLMDPDVNINMGAKFFADLIRTNDGDFRWASIAYNGGPGNLRRWKREFYTGDFYFFLESLPKEESRNYCRVTYQNYLHYATTYALYPEN